MAPGASDDDKGDKTQFGVAPPPQVKRTPQVEEKAAPEASPDHTQASGTPPPTPKAAAPAGEGTNHAIAPPPKPPRAPAAASALPPTPTETPLAQPDAEEDGTVIVTRNRSATATLQRVQPPGHSETIRLDRTSYVVGRSHKCDVRLYTESAHREHARLLFHDGAWYAEPFSGKTVIADGVKVREEQRLTHKMRLQLGGDELLFFDEGVAASQPEARPTAPPSRRPLLGVLLAVALVAALGLAAWWLSLRSEAPMTEHQDQIRRARSGCD